MLNPNKDGLLETHVNDGKNQIIHLAAEVNMSQAISKTCVVSTISPFPALVIWCVLGCALTFASEAKFEIEAKISFRLEAKKSLISHDSLRCETQKI